jgi:hypothetical protein
MQPTAACPSWLSECVREELELEQKQRNYRRKHGMRAVLAQKRLIKSVDDEDDEYDQQQQQHQQEENRRTTPSSLPSNRSTWVYETRAIDLPFCQPEQLTEEDIDEMHQEAEARANGTLDQYIQARAACEAADPRRHTGRSLTDVARETGRHYINLFTLYDASRTNGIVTEKWEERIVWGNDTPPRPVVRKLRQDFFPAAELSVVPVSLPITATTKELPPVATFHDIFNNVLSDTTTTPLTPTIVTVIKPHAPIRFSWIAAIPNKRRRVSTHFPPPPPPLFPLPVTTCLHKETLWGICAAPRVDNLLLPSPPLQPSPLSKPLVLRNPYLEAESSWDWLTNGIVWERDCHAPPPPPITCTLSLPVKRPPSSSRVPPLPEFCIEAFNVSCDKHYHNNDNFLVHEVGRNDKLDQSHAACAIDLEARWYSAHWTTDGKRVCDGGGGGDHGDDLISSLDKAPILPSAAPEPLPTTLLSPALEASRGLVLFEYLERDPLVLCGRGMTSQVLSYVRNAVPTDMSDVPGQVVRLSEIGSSPFSLGDIPSGVSKPTQVISNRLFSAPIALHQAMLQSDVPLTKRVARSPAQRDMDCTFLLVRDNDKNVWTYQALPPCFSVGQLEPKVVIPRPSTPDAHALHQRIIKSTLLRRFLSTPGASVGLDQMLAACGAEHETLVRRILKETCTYDRESTSWSLHKSESLLTSSQLQEVCTPEHWCIYDGMMRGVRRLRSMGISGTHDDPDELNALVDRLARSSDGMVPVENLRIFAIGRLIHRMLQVTPWNLTRGFHQFFRENKGSLTLEGWGNPLLLEVGGTCAARACKRAGPFPPSTKGASR